MSKIKLSQLIRVDSRIMAHIGDKCIKVDFVIKLTLSVPVQRSHPVPGTKIENKIFNPNHIWTCLEYLLTKNSMSDISGANGTEQACIVLENPAVWALRHLYTEVIFRYIKKCCR